MLVRRRTIGQRMKYTWSGTVILLLTLMTPGVHAQGTSSISQGFQSTDTKIVVGALVSLKQGTPNTLELGTEDNAERLLGVVGNKSVIELTTGKSSVQVVTNGSVTVLVSDINGSIKDGDKIAASPIAGVGMKATASTLVIGTAQADLSTADTDSRSVTDRHGKEKTVRIGAIPVQVDKVFYQATPSQNSFLPPVLQQFASTVAGHEVSSMRVVISALLVLLLFTVVTVLLYSSIRSSIISIGRNPLSKESIYKSLLEVGLSVLGMLVFAAIVIYLILTT